MRKIDLIVVHCSATKATMHIDAQIIREWHQQRGWSDIGYHKVIRRDGVVEDGRPIEQPGAHCKGHNTNSIGVCLVGGLDANGKPENNFTDEQFTSLFTLLGKLVTQYPGCRVLGHRDLSPDIDGDGVIEKWEWLKDCPCFDVREWLATHHAAPHTTRPDGS